MHVANRPTVLVADYSDGYARAVEILAGEGRLARSGGRERAGSNRVNP